METLMDILKAGDEADAAGSPFVNNWRQARSGLQLLDRARPLETALIRDFDKLFADKFEDMDAIFQDRLVSKRAYQIALREARRILASQGYTNDPWEALRAAILSNASFDMPLELLNGLKGPAKRADLAPMDITPQWVWTYDEALGVGNKRVSFRRGVVFFNRLFDFPEIVAAGLLPSTSLGNPPVYDCRGLRKHPLPTALEPVHATAREIASLWQLICVHGQTDLPNNPTPDELLKVWPAVCQIDPEPYGMKSSSFKVYLQRVLKALKQHASPLKDPDQMPSWLMDLGNKGPKYRKEALRGLWRKILSFDDPNLRNASAAELLAFDTWRHIWNASQLQYSTNTERQFESYSRNALLEMDEDFADPKVQIKQMWQPFSRISVQKRTFQTIYKAASRSYMRPSEVSAEWLIHVTNGALNLNDAKALVVTLHGQPPLQEEHGQLPHQKSPPKPSSVETEWTAFRVAIREQGVKTSRFGILSKPAILEGLGPRALNRNWVLELASNMSQKKRAELNMVLKQLEDLHHEQKLSNLLPKVSLGILPDKRSKGRKPIPAPLRREFDQILDGEGFAFNTLRYKRSCLSALYNEACERGLAYPQMSLVDLLATTPKLALKGVVKSEAQSFCRLIGL